MFRKTIKIAENERALVFQNQKLTQVLMPGLHKIWDMKDDVEFEVFDIDELYFSQKNGERLYQGSASLKEHIQHEKLQDTEVGMLYLDGMLRGVVAPGERLFMWKDAGDIRLDRIDIADTPLVEDKTLYLINKAGVNLATRLIRSESTVAVKPVAVATVKNSHVGLLYIDGKLSEKLSPGTYGYWQFNREFQLKSYDTRTQILEVSGQEIMTKDRVSLRINLTANIRILDAETAASSVDDVEQYAYKLLQLALREAIGTKALDDLLLDKLYVGETVKELVAENLKAVGVELGNVGMKDIILPGEIKAILNQVVEAQKAAEANVIKRREETAATRSLHNTAKVMENNPTLMRLKELEALEKVADKISNLNVYGGLEGLMKGVVKMT
ncbi:slipin family protein [Grimontia sp. S25]|uniref:Slipin family protein n=1 Tax=Grimontia sedimenti TaxID=2711294 RepID=A0A6M1R361_9GAMM|nr:slipin family protein [Grimontia sedimenti]NGN96705.1 slipin family protein [Grimontia sedimenti]